MSSRPSRERPKQLGTPGLSAGQQHQKIPQPGAKEEESGGDKQIIREEYCLPPRLKIANDRMGESPRAECDGRERIRQDAHCESGNSGIRRPAPDRKEHQGQQQEIGGEAVVPEQWAHGKMHEDERREHDADLEPAGLTVHCRRSNAPLKFSVSARRMST